MSDFWHAFLLHSLGMQNIYLFIYLCFLQLKKESTSSSTMPSVVHVVGVVYTPSCTKGKEVITFQQPISVYLLL